MGLFRRKRDKRLLHGHAEIVECWLPNLHSEMGNCKMTLRLDVPGLPPTLVKHHEPFLTPQRWPAVGMRPEVTVDADDLDDVDVHWDSIFGEMRGGVLGYAAEMAGSAAGIELDLSKGRPEDQVPESSLSDDEVMAEVARLNGEFAAGRITYDEMAAQIQQMVAPGTEYRPFS